MFCLDHFYTLLNVIRNPNKLQYLQYKVASTINILVINNHLLFKFFFLAKVMVCTLCPKITIIFMIKIKWYLVNINFVVNQDPMSWKKSGEKNTAKLLIYPFTSSAALNCNLINFCNKYWLFSINCNIWYIKHYYPKFYLHPNFNPGTGH